MAFSVKKYAALLSDMMSYMIANQSKITDFNEGSIARSLLEAIALQLEELYSRTYVNFNKELLDVPYYAFNFSKDPAQKASVSVVFSRAGTSGTVSIPLGTLIATSDGIQFETTAAGQITDGNSSSSSISAQAVEAGSNSNVAAAAINTIVTPILGVDSVTNAASATGGQDEESNASYLERFQEFIEGLGLSNVSGLKAGAKSVSGVRSASVIEHFPPSSGYNATVYIDDGAGEASAALLAAVQNVLLGNGTSTYPGYKAAGVNIQVIAPTKVSITVTVEIVDDGSISQESITFLAEQAISNYINNLEIGDDVIKNKIIDVIMSVSGVSDLTLTAPASNTSISNSQIARTGTITITFA